MPSSQLLLSCSQHQHQPQGRGSQSDSFLWPSSAAATSSVTGDVNSNPAPPPPSAPLQAHLLWPSMDCLVQPPPPVAPLLCGSATILGRFCLPPRVSLTDQPWGQISLGLSPRQMREQIPGLLLPVSTSVSRRSISVYGSKDQDETQQERGRCRNDQVPMQNWGEALPCTEGMAGTSLCRAEHSPRPFPRARQAPASSPTPTAPGSCPHLPTHTQRGGSPGAAQEGWGGQGQHSWGRGGCRPAFTDIIYVSATFTHFTGAGPKMKRCAHSHVSGWGKMQTRVSRCLDECSSCHPIP